MINSIKPEVSELQTSFEEIFVSPHLSDIKILETLTILRTKFEEMDKDKIKIFDEIMNNYKKITKGAEKTQNSFFFNEYDKLEFSKLLKNHLKLFRYVIYRYKYKNYPLKKIIEDYPPCVQIEPASICNFRCVMCFQIDRSFSDKKHNFMGFMNFDLYKKIIDELEGNVEAITLASRGEPTLNKKFIEFIKYCKDKFVALKINTNLSTMTEDMAKAIFENDVQTLVVSADAADKVSYEKIRVKGVFEKILKNLELLNKVKKQYPESRTIIRVSGVKINENQDFEQMKKVYGTCSDSVAFVNYLPWESSYENKINDIKEPCTDLWKRTFIWYDGKINPCDYDYKSVLNKHNIKDISLKDVWNSDYYNSLREKHLNKKRVELFPCNRCTNV